MQLLLRFAAVITISMLFLSACHHTRPTEHQQRTAAITYNSVTFTDYALNRNFNNGLEGPDKTIRISADKHGIRRTPSGTSEVFVVLRNHTDYNYTIEARTQFFDQSEIPTDAKPSWQRIVVPANATGVYLEKSITTAELKYRVEVRQAQ